ncbi:MAG: hypothetical protein JL50_21300 [Peptococcaceae bacterium BICA1-7]|nr:MAG: hypothetical protein JL50_21300 [Peptococcaceae bacterium BICA1-7]HBV97134.1 hypothetical protein [Desulfotomaculum sp.]
MPGFNGNGPLSRGPFTGKGQGYCIAEVGKGTSRGFGCGRGAGRGRKNCRNTAEKPFRGGSAQAFTPGAKTTGGGRQELDLLRERVKCLEAALELVTKERDQGQVKD